MTLLLEAGHHLAKRQINRLGVQVHEPVPLRFGQLFQGLGQVAHAGVVDQDVQAAKALLRGLEHGLDILGLGDVGAQGLSLGAQALSHCLSRVQIEIGHDHAGALSDKLLHHTRTKARSATGDHGHFVFESHDLLLSKMDRGFKISRV